MVGWVRFGWVRVRLGFGWVGSCVVRVKFGLVRLCWVGLGLGVGLV